MLETSVSYTKPILIKIDKDIIDRLDLDTIQLPLAIHLMLLQSCNYHRNYQTTFKSTPELIYEGIFNNSTSNSTTRAKIIDALKELHSPHAPYVGTGPQLLPFSIHIRHRREFANLLPVSLNHS